MLKSWKSLRLVSGRVTSIHKNITTTNDLVGVQILDTLYSHDI